MNRAYSILTVKSVEEDQRIIRGVATTPSPDRVGDIVEPLGVKFNNPMPLLWQHQADKPVGTVRFDKPTKDGITFEAKLATIDEPGNLKDRIDEAWQSVKAGLVSAVSIGFRALEYAFMESGGIRFSESEVMELSLVTIPANAEATITAIKSIDTEIRAASGIPDGEGRPVPPGVTGKATPKVKSAPKEGKKMTKTIAEQISAFEATRLAKAAELEAIMTETEGETLDADKAETADSLTAELKAIDDHLKRLRVVESLKASTAKPVAGVKTVEAGSNARDPHLTVQAKRNVEKGIIFTRLLGAKYLAYKHQVSPIDVARSRFADTPEVEAILKAPVAVGTTTDSTWASPLVELNNATGEFVELLRPATIIGRIPGLRRVPFNIKVPVGTQDPTAYWVGQASPKPVSAMAFTSIELEFNKVAGIVPMTEELMRFSNPAAEMLVRDGLVAAVAYLTDRDFLDPAMAGEAGVSPASVTNAVVPRNASGTTADAFRKDLGVMLGNYLAANMSVSGLTLVMTSTQALQLSLMRNALDQKEFPDIMASGGSVEGIPVITSENIVATGGSPADGYPIVALNAPDIYLADDGGVDIDISREASLQMDSAPDSPMTASTITVNLWQRNMVAIRAERYITWKKRRSAAVQYIAFGKYAS